MTAGDERTSTRRAALASLAGAALLVLLGAVLRVEVARADPLFDAAEPAGMLKSDPALLHYVTTRLREPRMFGDDLRADPRVQHPDLTDLPGEFTVAQEWLVARSHRALGVDEPLHLWATRLMALTASLSLLGVWGLVRELTRSERVAVLAALLAAVVPANYRTIGFVYLREDLSLPLLSLHLWALARALRTGGAVPALAAGALLGAALFTWHAMPFFVALEAVAVLGFGPSLSGLARARRAALAFAVGALPFVAARALLGGRGVDLSHVLAVVGAKLRHLGARPVDPASVPFDARLLWQGPFATPELGAVVARLGLALLVLLPVALYVRLRRERRASEDALLALALLALAAGWLFERTLVLAGLLLPAVGLVALARALPARAAAAAGAALAGLQLLLFVPWVAGHSITWWGPPERVEEERALFAWVREHVPAEDAVLCDFLTGPALLAFTGSRICLQPKYETDASRRKIEDFLTALYQGGPDDLVALARARFRARWLLVDVEHLWMRSMSWTAGMPADRTRPPPGSAAALFLGDRPAAGPDAAALEALEGVRLAWRSPAVERYWTDGAISRFWLFDLGPLD